MQCNFTSVRNIIQFQQHHYLLGKQYYDKNFVNSENKIYTVSTTSRIYYIGFKDVHFYIILYADEFL
jgi:hypothetical protein